MLLTQFFSVSSVLIDTNDLPWLSRLSGVWKLGGCLFFIIIAVFRNQGKEMILDALHDREQLER